MRTLSWILLTVVCLLLVLGSVGSLFVAYFGDPSGDVITGSTNLASLSLAEDVELALRGRRGTAASYSLAFAVSMLALVLGPFRKGDRWAVWVILVAFVILGGASLLRIPTLGIVQGATTGGGLLLIVIPAIALHLAAKGPASGGSSGS